MIRMYKIFVLLIASLLWGCAAKVTIDGLTDEAGETPDAGVAGAPGGTFSTDGGGSLLVSNSYIVFVNSSSLGFGSSSSAGYTVGDPLTEVGIEAVLDAAGGD